MATGRDGFFARRFGFNTAESGCQSSGRHARPRVGGL